MTSAYQPLPTSSPPRSRSSSPTSFNSPDFRPDSPSIPLRRPSDRPLRASVEAEFNRPSPAWWKRVCICVAIVVMGWVSVRVGGFTRDPEVVYASRYSDQFKYRPAASPVITEHLRDGRIRLRGATPGGVGVRENDRIMTQEQKRAEERRRTEEAREAAKERLGLRKRKRAGKGKAKPKGSKTV